MNDILNVMSQVLSDQTDSLLIDENLNSIHRIHGLILEEKLNCSSLIDFYLNKLVVYNRFLNVLIKTNYDQSKSSALKQDEYFKINKKLIGKLHCIPLLIKDNIDISGLPTTGAIKALRNQIPNENAEVVNNLLKEGAIILGKANLAELGNGGRYNSELGGACKNPYDLKRTCGTSSSGSAASVTSGLTLISLGTDSTGSIIGPASINSIYGLRPPHGALNMSGIISLYKREDTVGPFANYVDDLVLAYSIMAKNQTIYDYYKELVKIHETNILNNVFKIKIGYITNMEESFSLNSPLGIYSYQLDKEIKDKFNEFKENIAKIFDLKEVTLEERIYNKFIEIILPTFLSRVNCQNVCLKGELNEYFASKERFDLDAPYKSFNEFLFKKYDSNDLRFNYLLNEFWKVFLNNSEILGANSSLECGNACLNYTLLTNQVKFLVDEWFNRTNEADILIYPSVNSIPDLIDSSNQKPSNLFIASFTGYPSINVPIGFTKPSNSNYKENLLSYPVGDQKKFKKASIVARIANNQF
ncbi:unnamed protein product [Brachionus calyciflorus]|uniref:Amidase domain-containing protein n=1 Tax=Brachionus calyciflorus TaxID=104777 RepID=A0A814GP69_9BILA|nr:unnamed protein product [Brachionus calyciflorus]